MVTNGILTPVIACKTQKSLVSRAQACKLFLRLPAIKLHTLVEETGGGDGTGGVTVSLLPWETVVSLVGFGSAAGASETPATGLTETVGCI